MGSLLKLTGIVCALSVTVACSSSPGGNEPGDPGSPGGPTGGNGPGAPGAPGTTPPGTTPPGPTPPTPPTACQTSTALRDPATAPMTSTTAIFKTHMGGGLDRSVDGGKTWNRVDTNEPGSFVDYAVGDKLVVTVRDLGTKDAQSLERYAIRKSTDGGSTWSDAGAFSAGLYDRVTVSAAGDIYVLAGTIVGGKNGIGVHAVNAAGVESDSLTVQMTSTLSLSGADIIVTPTGDVVTATVGYVSSGGTGVSTKAIFRRSSDGGKTWSDVKTYTVNEPNEIDGVMVASDAKGELYLSHGVFMTASGSPTPQQIITEKGTTTFAPYDAFVPPSGEGFYVGWTTSTVDALGNLRIAVQEYPADGAQRATSIKSTIRTVAPGGAATTVDVTRPGADYTYITRQRWFGADLVLEGWGLNKTTNMLTETFVVAYPCL